MSHATDAGAAHDFPAFAKQTGNELLATTQEGNGDLVDAFQTQ